MIQKSLWKKVIGLLTFRFKILSNKAWIIYPQIKKRKLIWGGINVKTLLDTVPSRFLYPEPFKLCDFERLQRQTFKWWRRKKFCSVKWIINVKSMRICPGESCKQFGSFYFTLNIVNCKPKLFVIQYIEFIINGYYCLSRKQLTILL